MRVKTVCRPGGRTSKGRLLNLAPSRMAVVQIYVFYGVKFSLSIDATKLLIPEVCDTIPDDAGWSRAESARHA